MNDYTEETGYTGFQSACSEFAERPLSLDARYLQNKPSLFIIQVDGDSARLRVRMGDKLLVDRSKSPRDGQLVLLVVGNEFKLERYTPNLLKNYDSETGDFIWGVGTTLIREEP